MKMVEINLYESLNSMDIDTVHLKIKQLSEKLINEKFKTLDVASIDAEELFDIIDELAAKFK